MNNMLQDVSGVHAAIQGKQPASGTSGVLYQQETLNASTNTLDLMKTVAAFKEKRDRKILKLALQFYQTKRRIKKPDSGEIITIDPNKIRNIDFDINVIQNTDTPQYRQLTEERMMNLVLKGILDPMLYFQNSSDPTSKRIYESIKQIQAQQQQQQQQAQQAQQPQQAQTQNGEPEQSENRQADPRAMQLLQQAINATST
jgi:hypothetical protein